MPEPASRSGLSGLSRRPREVLDVLSFHRRPRHLKPQRSGSDIIRERLAYPTQSGKVTL